MSTLRKLSQITPSSVNPALTDQLVGVAGGAVEALFSTQQLANVIGRPSLSADTTFYCRTQAQTVTISSASPAVVSWTAHGLQLSDPVVFSLPLDRALVTISIASPGVVHYVAHGYVLNDPVKFTTVPTDTTAGSLPTGLTAGTVYYVVPIDADNFSVSATISGPAINTSGVQSGNQYVERASTLLTGVTEGTVYYVINPGLTVNSFQFSATPQGAAINTSGSTAGRITAATGNDANNGLTQTRSGACLSVGGTYAQANGFNFAGHTATIQLGDGTYTTNYGKLTLTYLLTGGLDQGLPWIGQGQLTVQGNSANTDAVRIKPSGVHAFQVNSVILTGYLLIQYFRLENPGGDVISAAGSGPAVLIQVGKNNFGPCNACATALAFSVISVTGVIQVLGNLSQAVYAAANGAKLSLEFGGSTTAVGSAVNCPKGIVDLSDDWGLNTFCQNSTHNFFGNFTGPQFSVAYGGQFYDFPFSGVVGAVLPPQMTAPAIKPFGNVWRNDTNTHVKSAVRDMSGATCDGYPNYQQPATGFSITLGNFDGNLLLDPAGVLATGTVTTCPIPIDGQMLKVWTSQTITGLTFAANAGQSVVNAPTTLAGGKSFTAFYRSANTTWYCAT